MLWTSVRGTIGVSVIGLTCLGLPAVEAQSIGLFSPIKGVAVQLDSAAPASRGVMTLRSRVVTMDLDRLLRARATGWVDPAPSYATTSNSLLTN